MARTSYETGNRSARFEDYRVRDFADAQSRSPKQSYGAEYRRHEQAAIAPGDGALMLLNFEQKIWIVGGYDGVCVGCSRSSVNSRSRIFLATFLQIG